MTGEFSRKSQISGSSKRGSVPPLGMSRVFEAVGRLGSMRRAAEELNLSHTVVSRHVRNLEGWLGTRLVIAGARGVQLTPEGVRFCQTIGRALDLIADATVELRPGVNRSILKLWCAPGLATRWLAPRLARLQQDIPMIDLVMHATEAAPDFRHHEADMVIRYGSEPQGDMRWARLSQPRMLPVASRAWLESRPPIRSLEDLARQPLIHEGSHDQWHRWFATAGYPEPAGLNGPRLGSASLAVEAAMMGQGIALATELLAADDLLSGRLVEILETRVSLEGYYMIAPRERWNSPAVSRFRAWILQAVAESQKGFTPDLPAPTS
jgi:LysR family transcriptional regulator, glycine cleavage system transcriptional activator